MGKKTVTFADDKNAEIKNNYEKLKISSTATKSITDPIKNIEVRRFKTNNQLTLP